MATECANTRCRVVLDARIKFEQQAGFVIAAIFVTDKVLSNWPPVLFEDSEEVVKMASNMQSPKIRMNFKFIRRPLFTET